MIPFVPPSTFDQSRGFHQPISVNIGTCDKIDGYCCAEFLPRNGTEQCTCSVVYGVRGRCSPGGPAPPPARLVAARQPVVRRGAALRPVEELRQGLRA